MVNHAMPSLVGKPPARSSSAPPVPLGADNGLPAREGHSALAFRGC